MLLDERGDARLDVDDDQLGHVANHRASAVDKEADFVDTARFRLDLRAMKNPPFSSGFL